MSDLIDRQAAKNLLEEWAGGYSYIETPTEQAIEEFQNLPSAQPTPCDVCRHNPPSSMDGKPCCICPAEGREGWT